MDEKKQNNGQHKSIEKQHGNSGEFPHGARIISYNVNEGERPHGIKIRFKIRVVTGKAATAYDRQQAEVIKEYLRWVRQYRQSPNSGHEDTR